MAKVVVTFDTVEKTCDITKDGKKLSSCGSASFYKGYEDKWSMSVGMSEHDKDNDTHMSHYLSASQDSDLAGYLQGFVSK